MGRNVNGMAREKGKLVTCLQRPQKSQLRPLWLHHEFQLLQLPQTLVSVSSTEWNLEALLRFNILHHWEETRDPGADFEAFS